MRIPVAFVVVALAASAACQTVIYVQQDDGGAEQIADGGRRGDGASADGPVTPPASADGGHPQVDAGPQTDAARQSDASCGPGSGVYPCGPFGTAAGATMANETVWGYRDANGNGSVTDDAGGSFDLAHFYRLSASGSKLLFVDLSAPWCSTCQAEAARLRVLYPDLHARGMEFMTVLWDLGAHTEARDWADYYHLPFATVDDSGPKNFEKYWDGSGVPMNMFIDLRTMKILSTSTDWDEAEFKAKANGYLNSP